MYSLHPHLVYEWLSSINKHNRMANYLKRKTHVPANCYSLQCMGRHIVTKATHFTSHPPSQQKAVVMTRSLAENIRNYKCLNIPKLKYFVQVHILTPRVSTATFNTRIFSGKWIKIKSTHHWGTATTFPRKGHPISQKLLAAISSISHSPIIWAGCLFYQLPK